MNGKRIPPWEPGRTESVTLGQDSGGDVSIRRQLVQWAPRVLLALAFTAAAIFLVVYLADGTQLKAALAELRTQPLLLAVLVAGYTGSFWLRAVA